MLLLVYFYMPPKALSFIRIIPNSTSGGLYEISHIFAIRVASNLIDLGYKFYNIYIYIYNVCCRSKERIKIYFKTGRSMKRLVFFEFIHFVLTYVFYMCMFPTCCFRQRNIYRTRPCYWGTHWNLNSVLFAIRIFSRFTFYIEVILFFS